MDTTTQLRTEDRPTGSAEHVTELAAPAERAYGLIEDVGRWPLLFAPCIWSQELERTEDVQRIRLWAVVGLQVRSWTSRRVLDPAGRRIEFAQEDPAPPLTSMTGHWTFEDGPPGRLELGHRWSTVDRPGAAERIAAALDANSDAEIAALRTWAERTEEPDSLILSFSDHGTVDAPAADVHAFLYRADRWPRHLPHVAGVDLETVPADDTTGGADVQTMDMQTSSADGSTHSTQSVRLCFGTERIVYKQTTPPRGLLAHSGEWLVTRGPDTTRVTARHTVAVDPAAVEDIFGAGTTVARAKERARDIIGANSRATLRAMSERLGPVGGGR
ncbi:aromatase/cyclase [Streptomyces sp. NBRC 110465]|uniref:aromatase/cyclase n=1 Tax=Streptomyces sp. NBRC 110465 TaxID=1897621 RepID=UPI001F286620|nr:aromatase/cyclase [Streptomyces sp. NBRC 110465]